MGLTIGSGFWLHRTLCDVLADMRRCDESKNYSGLAGLIEEAQVMGNRMEAALGQVKELPALDAEWHRLRKAVKEVRAEAVAAGVKLAEDPSVRLD